MQTHTKKYALEHRLVMEKHLGRFLRKGEDVHHINGVKDDNRIENLKIYKNHSEHDKDHFPKGSMVGANARVNC